MVGITSYGAYIPFWRLDKAALGAKGEKAVANFDEDSITMAVAAALDCLKGRDRKKVDSLLFGSTTSPYTEKLSATTVALACDLRRDIFTADFGDSLRAGTGALKAAADAVKAGSQKEVMVTAADCRLGAPGSSLEKAFGDGAAALLIKDSDVAAEIEAIHSVSNEMMDMWRIPGAPYTSSWEERFIIEEGYSRVTREAILGLLKKYNLEPKDFAKAVFYTPDSRSHLALARATGFDPKTQVQEPLFEAIGNTGAAYSLMMLIAALEEARAGERILLASYGNGADAVVLKVTEQIENIRDRRGIKGHLESKKVIDNYLTYLEWRGLLKKETVPRPDIGPVSMSAVWREQHKIFPMHGVRCKNCGTVQYPPERLCTKCASKDQFEKVTLSDSKGKIFSFSMDFFTSPLDVPLVAAFVDFDIGGRFLTTITDRVPEDINVGMPVEMTFRKLFTGNGFHNYAWKARPLRTK